MGVLLQLKRKNDFVQPALSNEEYLEMIVSSQKREEIFKKFDDFEGDCDNNSPFVKDMKFRRNINFDNY